MYYQQLKSESLRLADEIQQLKEELGAYPEGKLAKSTQHSSYVRWYHTNNGVKKYISVKNQAFMSQLATKEYLECL